MKISKLMLAMLATGVLGCSVLSQQAQATEINGTVAFAKLGNPAGFVSQAAGVTTLNFNNPISVVLASEDYAGTEGSLTTFTNISYSGDGTSAALVPFTGNSPEWTFMTSGVTYSFDLLSVSSAHFNNGTVGGITINGDGVAHIDGFQDTNASFSISGTGKGFTFTAILGSTTAVGNAVPEGGSALALLGFGLTAVEALRRKLAVA